MRQSVSLLPNKSLEQALTDLIERSIPPHLSTSLEAEMRLELTAHIEATLKDLALTGIDENKAIKHIYSSFGEPYMIQEQFYAVHRYTLWSRSMGKFFLFLLIVLITQSLLGFLLVEGKESFTAPILVALGVLPYVTVFFALTPIPWIFLSVGAFIYAVLSRLCLTYFPAHERRGRALLSMGIAVVGIWLSLFISEKTYVAQTIDRQHIYALAGFPFQAFEYSYSVSASLSQWLWFLIDWLCWLAFGIGAGFVVPRRLVVSSILPSIALIVMVLLTCDGLAYLFLRFD